MFAVTVRRKVRKTTGVKLNLRGFLYGNILPDISRKYGSHPHYMKDALPHVLAVKDSLLLKTRSSASSYKFAKELGAMNHYLSDFFCLPHTEGYSRSKAHHGIYELLMIARYRKGLRAYRALLKSHLTPVKPKDLNSFINEHNKTYTTMKASKINDIQYALFAGTKLSESMLANAPAIHDNKSFHEACVLES
jgi:hypothetical protein